MYIQTPPSPAESLILSEEGGISLYLNKRFLPYRPLRIEGKQRAEFTWYPGSPEATVQMLGPEEGVIRLNGFWKDRFFDAESIKVMGDVSANGLDIPLIGNVAQLVQIVDDMRRMGRRIKLSWSGLERVGHIIGFSQTWHNIHDCEWEIEFAVLSQGEETVPSVDPVAVTLPDVYATAIRTALEIQRTIQDAALLPEWVALTGQAVTLLESANLIAQASLGSVQSIAENYAAGIFSITQAAQRTVATAVGGVVNMGVVGTSIANSALSELYSFGIYGPQDNAPPGVQLSAYSFQRTQATAIRRYRYSMAVTNRAIVQQEASAQLQVQVYTVIAGEDLRTISNKFYKTPDYWSALMTYNNLNTTSLYAGQILNVPPRSLFDAKSATRGAA